RTACPSCWLHRRVSFPILSRSLGASSLLTVEHLAVLELADVPHADLVARLDGAAGAELAVVNRDALHHLDAERRLLVRLVALLGLVVSLFGLVLSRAGRALL